MMNSTARTVLDQSRRANYPTQDAIGNETYSLCASRHVMAYRSPDSNRKTQTAITDEPDALRGMPMTAHGAGFLQVIIGKLKTLLLDQTNRIIAAASRPIHRKAVA